VPSAHRTPCARTGTRSTVVSAEPEREVAQIVLPAP
jgi:hypothetical protein